MGNRCSFSRGQMAVTLPHLDFGNYPYAPQNTCFGVIGVGTNYFGGNPTSLLTTIIPVGRSGLLWRGGKFTISHSSIKLPQVPGIQLERKRKNLIVERRGDTRKQENCFEWNSRPQTDSSPPREFHKPSTCVFVCKHDADGWVVMGRHVTSIPSIFCYLL